MMDKKLVFCEDQSATAAFTSDVIDFGQEAPTTGLNERPLHVVAQATTAAEGDGALQLTIEDSDDNSEFATVLATGDITADELNRGYAFPMPLKHRRYVRISGATGTSALTAGAVTVYLSDVVIVPPSKPMEGLEYIDTIDE